MYYELMVINVRANFHLKDCVGMRGKTTAGTGKDDLYSYYLGLYANVFLQAEDSVLGVSTEGNLQKLNR